MRITAKADYAVRALVVLAAQDPDQPTSADAIADSQGIPVAFLLKILGDLRTAGLVKSRRGATGGYALATPATQVTIADVIRAVEGPLADVRGQPPEHLEYPAPTTALRDVWLATRVALRDVLERTTIGDIATDNLPAHVTAALHSPGADRRR